MDSSWDIKYKHAENTVSDVSIRDGASALGVGFFQVLWYNVENL